MTECHTILTSSRACERGTKGCVVTHDPLNIEGRDLGTEDGIEALLSERDLLADRLATAEAQLAEVTRERDEARRATYALDPSVRERYMASWQERDRLAAEGRASMLATQLCNAQEALRVARQAASAHETLALAAEAERDRLAKLFDDAGQGEHNVLALVDHYQERATTAEAELADCAREWARWMTFGNEGLVNAQNPNGRLLRALAALDRLTKETP